MTGRGIDHIGIASRNLDGLAAQYEALGFTLTPRAYHQDHMGTSNRLIQFKGENFIELLEVDRPQTMLPHSPGFMGFGQFNHDFLQMREGMSLIIFRTNDTPADLAAWKDKELDVYDQFNFERQATLPDGSEATVRFELGFVTHPKINVLFYVCNNMAERHFWKPEFQDHPNGAEELEAVVMVAEDPSAHATFLAALFNGDVRPCMDGLSVNCGPHGIQVCSPESLRKRGWVGETPANGMAEAVGTLIRAPSRTGTVTSAGDAGNVFINWI